MITINKLEASIVTLIIIVALIYGFCAQLYFSPVNAIDDIGYYASICTILGVMVLYLMFQDTIENLSKMKFRKFFTKQINEVFKSASENTAKKEIELNQAIVREEQIFHSNMFSKLLLIEEYLIKDGFLNENLEWVTKLNGKKDIKSLIAFLCILLEKEYFFSKRDIRIKRFFEERYEISLGENFQAARRQQYANEWKILFYNYPF